MVDLSWKSVLPACLPIQSKTQAKRPARSRLFCIFSCLEGAASSTIQVYDTLANCNNHFKKVLSLPGSVCKLTGNVAKSVQKCILINMNI